MLQLRCPLALLVHAIVRAESGYDPKAVSRKGPAGLMQLMPETARRYGVADPFDPAANLDAGVRYLRDLLNGRLRGDCNNSVMNFN